ncbi:hypothetical protein KV580_00750 [Pseudomonas chlororaphis]|nr:hypothetical protein [Pseudomonas chlororaphis]
MPAEEAQHQQDPQSQDTLRSYSEGYSGLYAVLPTLRAGQWIKEEGLQVGNCRGVGDDGYSFFKGFLRGLSRYQSTLKKANL